MFYQGIQLYKSFFFYSRNTRCHFRFIRFLHTAYMRGEGEGSKSTQMFEVFVFKSSDQISWIERVRARGIFMSLSIDPYVTV